VKIIIVVMILGLFLIGCESKCDCVAHALDNWGDSKSCTSYDYCYGSCKAMKNWDKRGSGIA